MKAQISQWEKQIYDANPSIAKQGRYMLDLAKARLARFQSRPLADQEKLDGEFKKVTAEIDSKLKSFKETGQWVEAGGGDKSKKSAKKVGMVRILATTTPREYGAMTNDRTDMALVRRYVPFDLSAVTDDGINEVLKNKVQNTAKAWNGRGFKVIYALDASKENAVIKKIKLLNELPFIDPDTKAKVTSYHIDNASTFLGKVQAEALQDYLQELEDAEKNNKPKPDKILKIELKHVDRAWKSFKTTAEAARAEMEIIAAEAQAATKNSQAPVQAGSNVEQRIDTAKPAIAKRTGPGNKPAVPSLKAYDNVETIRAALGASTEQELQAYRNGTREVRDNLEKHLLGEMQGKGPVPLATLLRKAKEAVARNSHLNPHTTRPTNVGGKQNGKVRKPGTPPPVPAAKAAAMSVGPH